jgi:hypothetical protein
MVSQADCMSCAMLQCPDQIASSVPLPPTSRTRIRAIAAVIRAGINWIAPGVRNIAGDELQPLFYSGRRTRACRDRLG